MAVGTNKGSLASSRQDSKSLVVAAGTTCPPCALNWMRPGGGLSTQAWNAMFGPNFPIPSDTLCPLLLLPCLSASPPPVQLLDQTERRQQIPVIFCTSGLRGGCSGADTIAPNGILTSLLFFSNWVPLPSDSFSTDIWDPAAHFG